MGDLFESLGGFGDGLLTHRQVLLLPWQIFGVGAAQQMFRLQPQARSSLRAKTEPYSASVIPTCEWRDRSASDTESQFDDVTGILG